MEFDHFFLLAMQSSFILGLIHGVNPCGHSWLVLTPFILGTKKGGKVAFLTFSFLAGTTLACLLLGATLGAISAAIPPSFVIWVETTTSVILISLGLIMVVKPHLLHHHEHHENHDLNENCSHGHCSTSKNRAAGLSGKKRTGTALFGIGFINMIIPCPTAAIMYSFALESGSYWQATAVFGIYAVATSLAVSLVIYGIFKISTLLKTLSQDWIEAAIMRTVGVLTVFFGIYSIYLS